MAFPLQTSYLTTSDPKLAIVLLGVLGIGVALLMITNISKYGFGPNWERTSARKQKKHKVRPIGRSLKKAASTYGFDSEQTAFLERAFLRAQVSDPKAVLADQDLLDRHFKKAFKDIEADSETEAAAEESKSVLFSIRTVIDSSLGASGRMVSTGKLPDGIPTILTDSKGETYPSRVISAKQDYLLIEAPKNPLGEEIKFSRGTKLSLSLYAKAGSGHHFQTKVLGTETTAAGPALRLSHSNSLSSLPSRRHRRKDTQLSCAFSLVQIVQRSQGRKIVKETIVDEARTNGTIVDISAGGCAVKSTAPLKTGEFIKVEFEDVRGRGLAAFGRVVRTNKIAADVGVMHIQFLKTTKKTMNAVYAVVYGYEQE
jgi:hypothetical protein